MMKEQKSNSAQSHRSERKKPSSTRREVLVAGMLLPLAAGCAGPQTEETDVSSEPASVPSPEPPFQISLAQWSLHREHFGDWARRGEYERFENIATDPDSLIEGSLDPLDFAEKASALGFAGVEYVNTFFYGKVEDQAYLADLKARAEAAGVESLLIMCDALGSTGDPDETARQIAVESHFPWIEAAAFLGCHAVRVNAYSSGGFEEQQDLVADGLRSICEFADQHDISVLVENHGGFSSNGKWLAAVMEKVDHPRIGTLPDFGNFRITEPGVEPEEWYDRYQGVAELMPWAKAVSAKSYGFDEAGNETTIDFERMMQIVLDAGYGGWVGVEFEGAGDSEAGIVATRKLLERIRDQQA